MQPVRQVYNDAPHSIIIQAQFHNRRIELIIWPLIEETEQTMDDDIQASFYDLAQEFCGCIKDGAQDLS